MKYYQITTEQLRVLEKMWQSTLNRFRGPIPMGLALAHMQAETNGQTDPVVRDLRRRPIGLMGIPRLTGLRFKYAEEYLKIPVNNLYVWSLKTNKDAHKLHQTYATTWTSPDYDFWLAVRLMFILGDTSFNNLVADAKNAASAYTCISGIQAWVRTQMIKTKRYGRYTYRDLNYLMDHLDTVKTALIFIDGPDKASYTFSEAPSLSPGAIIATLEATVF